MGTGCRARPTSAAGLAASQTEQGTLLGTLGYMSPEQLRGEPADMRSDIFALGCVLYEMATGERAFARASAADTLAAIVRDEPPCLSTGNRLPAGLRGIVAHCLEKRPGERFQSARDLSFALRSVGSADAAAFTSIPLARPRGALAALALALAVLAGAGWILALRRTPAPSSDDISIAQLEQLTLDSGLTTTPAVSRDGKLLAYASDRGDGDDLDIWVQQLGVNFGTGLGDAITRDGFMYEGSVERGNIWRLLMRPPHAPSTP